MGKGVSENAKRHLLPAAIAEVLVPNTGIGRERSALRYGAPPARYYGRVRVKFNER